MTRLRPHFMLLLAALLAFACAEDDTSGEQPVAPESFDDSGPSLIPPGGKADDVASSIPAYAPLAESASLDVSFEALFSPDDPVATVEMTLIDEVIEARRAVADEWPEGENPFRIRYAVYNLRNPDIVSRLIEAERAGVDVQILIDDAQLDPDRTWNTADETLIAAGFEFVADHRDADADRLRTADLIGIGGSGLMHVKARLFETPDERVLLTGSLNPGDNAMLNEETLHLVRDEALFAEYAATFEALRDDRDLANAWDDSRPVNVLFTPVRDGLRAGTKVLDWVAEEDEQILLMVFSLRDLEAPGHDRSLVEILGDKVAEGVPVYVITDRKQSDGVDSAGNRRYWDDWTEDRLREVGVHVYEATNRATEFTAMHHKVAVLGKTRIRVITDAANWTKAGLGSVDKPARNVESQLFIDSAALDDNHTGRRYMAQWLRVLDRYADQSADDGEPSAAEVRARLMSADDWPTQPVSAAFTGWTSPGESLALRGSADALGNWGQTHAGLGLYTDGDSYPLWRNDGRGAGVPVGATLAWKAVILRSDGSAAAWERGDDRSDYVQGDALLDPTRYAPGTLLLDGTWR